MKISHVILVLLLLELCQNESNWQFKGMTLQGQWNSTTDFFRIPEQNMINFRNQNNVSFFQTVAGQLQAYITEFNTVDPPHTKLYLQLSDPLFLNKRLIILFVQLPNYPNQLNWSNIITTASIYLNLQHIANWDLTLDLTLILSEANSLSLTIAGQSLQFQGFVKPKIYPWWLLSLLAIYILQAIMCYYRKYQNSLNKARSNMRYISIWFILHYICFALMCSLAYIKLAFSNSNSGLSLYLLISLSNCIIVAAVLLNYKVIMEQLRNKFVLIKAVIFGLIYALLAIILYAQPTFWIVQTIILFGWQITNSILIGGTHALTIDLLAIITLGRILVIILLLTSQLFNLKPANPSHFAAIIIVYLIGILFIQLQSCFGGRILIPNSLIADYYNYYCQSEANDELLTEQCPICLIALRNDPLDECDTQSAVALSGIVVGYMKAPCKHVYHIKCLSDWMDTRLVCPICRRTLPPLTK